MRMLVILTASLAMMTAASGAPNPHAGKKLVEYGWDCPDTPFVRQQVAEMEKIAFDGVVIRVTPPSPEGQRLQSLGWRVFSKVKFATEEYEHAIADLQATKFMRLTDNFIQVIAQPGDVDWFDPEWSAIAHNAACLARVAKQGRCKGIMFDPEMYTRRVWDYKAMPPGHTSQEYAAKVKERGKEFIRAINKEFPDIVILALFGHSLAYVQSGPDGLKAAEYGLLAAFYDGICEAATAGTILVDGYEFSYPYWSHKQYQDGRKIILEQAKTISTNKKAFAKHVRAGFGVWADYDSGKRGWHPDDFSKNYWTPGELRAALSFALESSDEYVWVYSERLCWWDFNVPALYRAALELAKFGPGVAVRDPSRDSDIPHAADQRRYSDAETFSQLPEKLTEIFDFPKDGWKFKREENDLGKEQGWYKVGFDDSAWRTISIGKFWEEQGEPGYDGIAWYRLSFKFPQVVSGKPVFLAVGAADESAWVWLNGEPVGSHDIGPGGWEFPFALDVSGRLRPGAENVLAVRVLDTLGAGGIWKSVKLMVK